MKTKKIMNMIESNIDEFVRGGEFDPTALGQKKLIEACADGDEMFIVEAINGDEEAERLLLKFVVLGIKNNNFEEIKLTAELWEIHHDLFYQRALNLCELHYLDEEAVRYARNRLREMWDKCSDPNNAPY